MQQMWKTTTRRRKCNVLCMTRNCIWWWNIKKWNGIAKKKILNYYVHVFLTSGYNITLYGLTYCENESITCVTYWRSTEPSIKRCTCVNKQRSSGNRCIRSKISECHLDLWTWLNSVQMRTPTGSRWVSNNYIPRCHRWLVSVRGSES